MATHNARLGKYLVLTLLCLGLLARLLAGLSASGDNVLLAQEATAEATSEVVPREAPNWPDLIQGWVGQQ